MSFLYWATFAVNLLALVLAIWLGLYLISRNPRHAIAWLTALMLWLLAGVFLNVLLVINPPPVVTLKLTWLRLFFPFWPRETLVGTNKQLAARLVGSSRACFVAPCDSEIEDDL